MIVELKSRTLADDVAQNIIGYIRKAKLVPGDLIPKEEEIASKLNVSRHIVREGVSQLKAYGLVESRQRRGTVVATPKAFAGINQLAEAEYFSEQEWKEFLGLRITMEIGMADIIYALATPEDITDLRSLAGKRRFPLTAESEIAFHGKLFSIGGSDLANQFMDALKKSFYYSLTVSKDDSSDETKNHYDICDALEFGTKEEFSAVMKIHFQKYTEFMISSRKEENIK